MSGAAAAAMPWGGGIPKERGDQNLVQKFFALLLAPFKWALSNIGSLLVIALIILSIYSLLYIGLPTITNLDGFIGTNVLQGIGFLLTDGIRVFSHNVNCAMNGGCVTADTGTDQKNYGIFITDVYTTQSKFRQWDPIVIKASARGELLTSMGTGGCANVECSLEDGNLRSGAKCIPLKELSNNVIITCTFEPMVSKDANIKSAKVGLVYNFKTEATLPISMVDSTEYNQYLDKYLAESESYSEAEGKLASFYDVEMDPPANPKKTPIVIGAKIDRSQPVPKGNSYTTLLISVQNQGGGTAKINDISIALPGGMTIAQSAELNYNAPTPVEWADNTLRSIFNKESLPSLDEDIIASDFRRYDFALDTSGFQLESIRDYATTRKIYITVDYTYNTSSSRLVTVATCQELGNCGTQVADAPAPDTGEV